jgi:hypothetical protein
MGAAQTSRLSPNEIKPTRVQNFANFFKGYMGLWSVVTAALPIPVTAFKLIPTYKAYTPILSTYTSLFCFLLLGYVFYSRHRLAWLYFGEGPSFAPKRAMALLPALLIILCLVFVFFYHVELKNSLLTLKQQLSISGPGDFSTDRILSSTDYRDIPDALELMVFYLGIFLSAELAFIFMATREYLQDAIGIPETELFGGVGTRPAPESPPCIVFFTSEPSGAIVHIDRDDVSVGFTPCSAKVAIGIHEVRLKKYGYEDWQGPLEVKAEDRTLPFEVALKKL